MVRILLCLRTLRVERARGASGEGRITLSAIASGRLVKTVRLDRLLDRGDIVSSRGLLDVEVSGVSTDSRRVAPGHLFVCLPGYDAAGGEVMADRHRFVSDALRNGAAAFLVEREVEVPEGVPVVRVADTWVAAATAAARFHGEPSRNLFAVGVTGTSGKTSTSYFMDAVLRSAGHNVARLGTIDYRIGDEILSAEQTTPEAPVVQDLLRRAGEAGCTAVVMEVSSHALALRRVGAVHFDAAVFTNLSRDHLNFHPDMESYRAAKAMLFSSLDEAGKESAAFVNLDDEEWQAVIGDTSVPRIGFGLGSDAEVGAEQIQATMAGLSFVLRTPDGRAEVRLPHLADYHIHNALAAAAVGFRLGLSPAVIASALARAEVVPGRFEVIDVGQDFVVVIDYAHKPAALEGLLRSARRLRPRRIITVFGCGGDRDRGKRPLMGRIASEASDLVVVTSDNPRGEDPSSIVDEIVVGSRDFDSNLDRHLIEVDRGKAIRRAIGLAQSGDMVIIAGKGHEPYQLVAGESLRFDDREHARAALAAR